MKVRKDADYSINFDIECITAGSVSILEVFSLINTCNVLDVQFKKQPYPLVLLKGNFIIILINVLFMCTINW